MQQKHLVVRLPWRLLEAFQRGARFPETVTNPINKKISKSYRRRISPSLGALARPGRVQRVRRLARVGELGALLGDHDELV